ncbi:E3 ubiquitin-protein ligase SIAH1B-like [Sitodiplosis mosellana]|uniref:E3 ubiquitin-protein ligase SIAH1B-like n=1 Tax=Sitodiplosis mosellana TaxID=263140 RepID=UPI00244516A4|nr:E3 ubiquitin-protein ligase SIAH1B-like [Sitodiplosis mosellana]
MASANNSQSFTIYECHYCNAIPNEHQINRCSRGHIVCLKCDAKYGRCKCMSETLVKVPNPLLKIVESTKKGCQYKDDGCTWIISERADTDDHHAECKFRPSRCIGAQLGVWICDWTGLQVEFPSHMKEHHSTNGEFFLHRQIGSVNYDPANNCTKFNLIDAFNKKFVFLYMSHAKSSDVVFIIYLLGRKIDAQKFMIDFELKDDELRKVKFIEMCFSDADNIATIIRDHRCFVLSKRLVESFVKNGNLEFRFVIKKKDGIVLENIEKQQHLLNVLCGEAGGPTPQLAPKMQMKAYQSESNLYLSAGRSNGAANNKPRYHRNTKK